MQMNMTPAKQRCPESETTVVYDNYKFFTVDTKVKY